jgi:hypothetical protein
MQSENICGEPLLAESNKLMGDKRAGDASRRNAGMVSGNHLAMLCVYGVDAIWAY